MGIVSIFGSFSILQNVYTTVGGGSIAVSNRNPSCCTAQYTIPIFFHHPQIFPWKTKSNSPKIFFTRNTEDTNYDF